MPFFCDLIGPTILDPKVAHEELLKKQYLIPYSQVLYRDVGEKENAEMYEPLIVAPFDGTAQERVMTSKVDWGGSTDAVKAANDNADTQTARASIAVYQEQVNAFKSIYNQASAEGQRTPNNAAILQTLAEQYLPGWINRGLIKDASSMLAGSVDIMKDWPLLGRLIKEAENSLANLDTPVNTIVQKIENSVQKDTLDINEANFHHYIKSATVNLLENNSRTYEIQKTIVCQQSNPRYANACVRQLYLILSTVTPTWDYIKTSGNTQNIATICWTAPNNFTMTYISNAQKTPDIFSYRGSFQLRKGYTVYRRLVPSNVTVKFSSDKIRIDTQNSDDIFQPTGTNPNSEQNKTMSLWRKLVVPIQSQNQKIAYILFPQWIDITVELQEVEPVDPLVCVQKMFCYADRAVVYTSSGSATVQTSTTSEGANNGE